MHMHKWRYWFSGFQYPWVLAWRKLKSLLIDLFTGISRGLINGQLGIEEQLHNQRERNTVFYLGCVLYTKRVAKRYTSNLTSIRPFQVSFVTS
jgi:hypothetical protein